MINNKITPKQVKNMMAELSEEHQKTLGKLFCKSYSKDSIGFLNGWISQYDAESPIDTFLAVILNQVIIEIGSAICDDLQKARESEEKTFFGTMAIRIAIEKMREIASAMESIAYTCNEKENEKSN